MPGKEDHENGPVHHQNKEALDRGAWGGKLEFILTCVGYAVGLGNVWRFPYLAFKNGGGAFLIPYILMLFFCGMPLFFFEISFGQFASLGPLGVWSASPLFKGIGIGCVIVSTYVSLYYNILMSYILYYFFASMGPDVPWRDCNNPWNTRFCLTATEFKNVTNETLAEMNATRSQLKTPTEEYFYNKVLSMTDGIHNLGPVNWQLACCLFIAWLVVFMVLIKGISSLGKVVYFTSTFPYIMMTVMVIRGATLPGALEGVKFYMVPNVTKLRESEVWSDAAAQIFFSLSTSSGGLIAMASYNSFHNNVFRDGILVPIINCLTSIYSGFSIFCVLGFMAQLKGLKVSEVATSGPGLVFVVYPEGLAQLTPSSLWAILFFFMMTTLGFSSQFSIVECVFVALMDEFPGLLRSTAARPMLLRGIFITTYFLISLPMVTNGGFYLFTIADRFAGGFPRLFIGTFQLIIIMWVYGYNRFADDISMMIGHRPNIYFRVCWSFVAPLIVLGIVAFRAANFTPPSIGNYIFPNWAVALGWLMVASVVMWIPLYAFFSFCNRGGFAALKKAARPLPHWGPAFKENRTGRYAPAFCEERPSLPSITRDRDSATELYNSINVGDMELRMRPQANGSVMNDLTEVKAVSDGKVSSDSPYEGISHL